jgi:hypothetical protein
MQAESVGKELILELESRRAAEPRADGESGLGTSVELGSTENGEQRNRLEKLAGKSAVEQADLEAAGWTIEVLRMRLEEAEAGRLRAEELEIRLTQAQDELAQELVLLHQLKASSEAEAR